MSTGSFTEFSQIIVILSAKSISDDDDDHSFLPSNLSVVAGLGSLCAVLPGIIAFLVMKHFKGELPVSKLTACIFLLSIVVLCSI